MNILKVRTFVLRFSTEIAIHEIPLLRGAIINATKNENILFHNHDGDRLRYAYPLVQYKRIGGKAAIVFVGDGVEAAADYFRSNTLSVALGGRAVALELEHADAHTTTVSLWDDTFCYTIRKYLPFNQHNYAEYQRTGSLAARYAIIERALTGNILSFAKGAGLHVDGRIALSVTDCTASRAYIYKGVRMSGFDLAFKTNITMPDYIGLGKGTSLGFGTIKRMTNK